MRRRKTLKELRADPEWVALHNKTMAAKRLNHQRLLARVRGHRNPVKALYAMPSVGQNEAFVFGEIDENAAFEFKTQLGKADPSKPLVIHIDSQGGSCGPAASIFDAVDRWASRTIGVVESNAYSCGSYIAMACDERHITANGMLMVHAPYIPDGVETIPSDHELTAKLRVQFATAYARHCKGGRGMVENLLSRPEGDAWLTANEALQMGLVTKII